MRGEIESWSHFQSYCASLGKQTAYYIKRGSSGVRWNDYGMCQRPIHRINPTVQSSTMAEGLFSFSAFPFMDFVEHPLASTVFSPVTNTLCVFLRFTLPVLVTWPDELKALVVLRVRIYLLNKVMNTVNICVFLNTVCTFLLSINVLIEIVLFIVSALLCSSGRMFWVFKP